MFSLPDGKDEQHNTPVPGKDAEVVQPPVSEHEELVKEEVFFDGRLPLRVFHLDHSLLWLLLIGWNIGIFISIKEKYSRELKITSLRIVVTTGLVAQRVEQVDLYRVVGIERNQSVLDRVFGVGEIEISCTEDKTAPKLVFRIPDPGFFAEKIKGCVFTERRKRRSFTVD